MNTFDMAAGFVLQYEGEISNDPRDSGGLTKWGISQRSHPSLDIKNLTREKAKAIYLAEYWKRCRCDGFPQGLAIVLFDAAVNQGAVRAIRMLQKSLGVRADGVIGPKTLAAAAKPEGTGADSVLSEFIARRAYQYAMHPGIRLFGLGWFRRLVAVHRLASGL